MAQRSTIEWTDATWNPIRGCSRVSEGCRNCYAEGIAVRFSGLGQAYEGLAWPKESTFHGWTSEVRFIGKHLEDPLHWEKPRMIFVNSMSDLFHPNVLDEWIERIFAVMALCPRHTFQILTKRPGRMQWYLNQQNIGNNVLGRAWEMLGHHPLGKYKHEGIQTRPWPLANVWLGVSVEDQQTADERIPLLLQTPAAIRWVSYEPALGPVNFTDLPLPPGIDERPFRCNALTSRDDEHVYNVHAKLDWIVAGGESGPGARPAHPDWFRSARNQCESFAVPFFFKQWGEWQPFGTTDGKQEPPFGDYSAAGKPPFTAGNGRNFYANFLKLGKKAAGCVLDGREHKEYPAR